MSNQFPPTPRHGAAYRYVLERIGGPFVIGECSTRERRAEVQVVLDEIVAWVEPQPADVRAAYVWGIAQVTRDLDSRLAIFENARAVEAAYESLPKPPTAEDLKP